MTLSRLPVLPTNLWGASALNPCLNCQRVSLVQGLNSTAAAVPSQTGMSNYIECLSVSLSPEAVSQLDRIS